MTGHQNTPQSKQAIRPVVYGIGIYFLSSCTDSFQIGSAGSLLKVLALIPLGLSLLDIKSWKIRFGPTLVAQFAFWLMTVVSVLYSVSPDKTVSSLKALTLNLAMIFCLGILEEYNKRELQFMQRSLLGGGWITVLMMLLFSDVSANGRLTLLLGSHTQDQNYINGYFLYTFSWHCCQMLVHKKKLHLIPTVFILSIVLLTGSRGALLAFLIVFFVQVCFMFANTKHKLRNIFAIGFLLVLLLVVFDAVLSQMPESVARRYSWDYLSEKGTTGRTEIWKFFLRHFSGDSIGRMLFGHGYGTSTLINTMNELVAHNLYLENLITLGIFGMFLQLIIQGTVIWILFKRRQHALLGAYLGMMVMCLSLSLVAYKPIWNVMLLALAIDTHHKNSGLASQSGKSIREYNPQEVLHESHT